MDITTRSFAFARCVTGTVVRLSEWFPVVATRTLGSPPPIPPASAVAPSAAAATRAAARAIALTLPTPRSGSYDRRFRPAMGADATIVARGIESGGGRERGPAPKARGARGRAHGVGEPARVRRHHRHLRPSPLRAGRHRRRLRRARGGGALFRGDANGLPRSAKRADRATPRRRRRDRRGEPQRHARGPASGAPGNRAQVRDALRRRLRVRGGAAGLRTGLLRLRNGSAPARHRARPPVAERQGGDAPQPPAHRGHGRGPPRPAALSLRWAARRRSRSWSTPTRSGRTVTSRASSN